jgi:hypothetical protein
MSILHNAIERHQSEKMTVQIRRICSCVLFTILKDVNGFFEISAAIYFYVYGRYFSTEQHFF